MLRGTMGNSREGRESGARKDTSSQIGDPASCRNAHPGATVEMGKL